MKQFIVFMKFAGKILSRCRVNLMQVIGWAIALVLLIAWLPIGVLPLVHSTPLKQQPAEHTESTSSLPVSQPHPLPQSLVHWQDTDQQGDYFDQIQPTPLGYLVWSQFPIRVYVEPPIAVSGMGGDRSPIWFDAVIQAVQEWHDYLPLVLVNTPEAADITVLRQLPRLRRQGTTFRAQSAETRYELYLKPQRDRAMLLAQRFTIVLRSSQSAEHLKAAARHELGHTLGIWGHSPVETDALYFSQIRQPVPISARDINTLKRIYEQPTRIGWTVERVGSAHPSTYSKSMAQAAASP
jgi:predicted Zn-dependent protease